MIASLYTHKQQKMLAQKSSEQNFEAVGQSSLMMAKMRIEAVQAFNPRLQCITLSGYNSESKVP